jgi:eukaryotic-like serine/threonine-protein kinase
MHDTYHLYHHQPDPLCLEEVKPETWLVNNALRYSVVATIQARSCHEAYQAMRSKNPGRFAAVREGNVLRETLPGDVFVGEKEAWMVMSDSAIQRIPYQTTTPYKYYTHDSYLYSLSWSPDGNYLAAGDGGGDVLIHDLHGPDEIKATSYARHRSSSVHALAWSPDGTHIASSASYEGEAHVWEVAPKGGYKNAANGSILICRKNEEERWMQQIDRLTWFQDSRRILAGRESGSIIAWDAVTGACLFSSPRHQGKITDLALSPDGMRIASASSDKTIRVWELAMAPEQDLLYQGHTKSVLALDWSPDGAFLVSCEENERALHLWSSETGDLTERIPLSIFSTRPAHVTTVRWSPTGKYIAAGCDDGTVQMVDVESLRHCWTYRSGQDAIDALAWAPDGSRLASASSGWKQRVEVWQVEAAGESHDLKYDEDEGVG